MKNTNLVAIVLVSFCIGFVCGAVYSSLKLEPGIKTEHGSVQKDADKSAENSGRIFRLEQYLLKNPEDADAWASLGNMFFDSDRVKDAIHAYEKSLALNPAQVHVITDLGIMYRRSNQPRRAIEAFDRAIAIDPSFESARFNKGVVLLHDLNDIDGCIRAWEQLVKVNPLATAPDGHSVDALVQDMKKRRKKGKS